jgi:hypothetical protein
MKPSPNTESGFVKLRVNGAIPCDKNIKRPHYYIKHTGSGYRLSTNSQYVQKMLHGFYDASTQNAKSCLHVVLIKQKKLLQQLQQRLGDDQ